MTASKYAPPLLSLAGGGFAAVLSAARLHLCAMLEEPEVGMRHAAALVAFTPTVWREGNWMRIRFEHGPTALWLSETLAEKGVELIDVDGDGATVAVPNPRIALRPYGFCESRWVFGRGLDAALGISRGAVHAAAAFNRRGMKVACPSGPMMLTLTAAMARLHISAKPTDGEPRAAVGAHEVAGALARLGIADVGAHYRRAAGAQP
jgi:hypothetical protein